MNLAPFTLQQTLVRRLLQQGVAECVAALGTRTLENDIDGNQPIQISLKLFDWPAEGCSDEIDSELAPEGGRDLSHFLGRTQPIEPRGQGVTKSGRNMDLAVVGFADGFD